MGQLCLKMMNVVYESIEWRLDENQEVSAKLDGCNIPKAHPQHLQKKENCKRQDAQDQMKCKPLKEPSKKKLQEAKKMIKLEE